jgi:hypothetical protein
MKYYVLQLLGDNVFLSPWNTGVDQAYNTSRDLSAVCSDTLVSALSEALQFASLSDIILAFYRCESINIFCPFTKRFRYVTLEDFEVIEVSVKMKTVEI